MAKKNGKGSTKMVSPMYDGGSMNGPVYGPKGGTHIPDPSNYLNSPGQAAPSGSMTDHGPDASPPRQPKNH
jgi:hypothetical protein